MLSLVVWRAVFEMQLLDLDSTDLWKSRFIRLATKIINLEREKCPLLSQNRLTTIRNLKRQTKLSSIRGRARRIHTTS